jgi:hypothetical protein
MNRGIELHDTRIERIERRADSIVLWLSAYVHETGGRPGVDPGTGWSQPARLVIENGEYVRPFTSQFLWVLDGRIAVGDRLFDNRIPLPFDEHGETRVFLSGEEGELMISGTRVYVETIGPALYVEENWS